ncbi:hypothetical protein [Acidihalobacter yilgarnensis]|nr:hypothetical protein [Acidihalobacter yilgarnensis]
MNLAEVLTTPAVKSGDAWFRPVAWRGANCAYALKDGRTYRVPIDPAGK